MADPSTTNQASGPQPNSPKAAVSEGNPALRAMGLPNWKLKLPSRNWLIFLTITGSWTGALLYDRRQKKKNQQKWSTLVSHIAAEPLPTTTLPRRVTIFLAAPPGDGLRSAREHFVEYVKPVLVAAAMDWDVVEGRREGEVRAALAERIRRKRRKAGEYAESEIKVDVPLALERVRDRIGVQEYDGVGGDIVLGRHTWKEYVRGYHEGWLGPLDMPQEIREQMEGKPITETAVPLPPASETSENIAATPDSDLLLSPTSAPITSTDASTPSADENSPQVSTTDTASDTTSDKKAEEEKPTPPPKPAVTIPYNTPSSYSASTLPASIPSEFSPSAPIAFPHILGFLKTPIRMYRFLNRRQVADDIGRQTAAAVLAAHRQYSTDASSDATSSTSSFDHEHQPRTEQERALLREEKEWHKSARKREEGEDREREWLDEMVLDERIASRMRRFQLSDTNEERARRIGEGSPGIPGKRVEEEEV